MLSFGFFELPFEFGDLFLCCHELITDCISFRNIAIKLLSSLLLGDQFRFLNLSLDLLVLLSNQSGVFRYRFIKMLLQILILCFVFAPYNVKRTLDYCEGASFYVFRVAMSFVDFSTLITFNWEAFTNHLVTFDVPTLDAHTAHLSTFFFNKRTLLF